MPLSKQEQKCIEFACRHLGKHYGGNWSIQKNLDDLKIPKPTPEVIVGNGKKTAAIEVKRLVGDSAYQEYIAYLRSNQKFLAPPCGGSYYLCPPVDFHLPMPDNLRRLVKREIERVAPTLGLGQKGAIRIPRQGHISLISESDPPFIYCLHECQSEVMSRITERISGKFILIDEGLEHSFVTQQCRDAFTEAVIDACKKRLEGDTDPFKWDEEWEFVRIGNNSDEHSNEGVWLLATTDPRSVPESVEECVHIVLNKAMLKFKERWADFQIIVLESSGLVPVELAAHSVETFQSKDKSMIDHFLLVEDEDVVEASTVVSSLAQAAKDEEQRQRHHILNSPISEVRVQRFKDDYLKCRQEIGATEKIFRYYDSFQYQAKRNALASFGFKRLMNKGPFVDGSNWLDLRGLAFAVAEERHLLKNLESSLATSTSHTGQILSDKIAREPEKILDAAKEMATIMGLHDKSLIVLATPLDVETLVSFNEVLTVRGWELGDELKTNRILGKYEDCPIIHLNEPGMNSLYVVDMPRFASLTQYDPLVDLRVLAIGEIEAKHMLEDNPNLKSDVNTLLSMVHLILYQSYEIQIHNQHAAWALKFSP